MVRSAHRARLESLMPDCASAVWCFETLPNGDAPAMRVTPRYLLLFSVRHAITNPSPSNAAASRNGAPGIFSGAWSLMK